MKRSLALTAAIMVAGCAGWNPPSRLEGDFPGAGPLVPDATLLINPSTSISLEKLVNWGIYVGIAYLVTDPFNPNWYVEQASLADDLFHLELKMKRYYAGGAGEARAAFHRRAKDLARQGSFDGYEVLEYQESLDSSVLGSQRTATGVVRLTGKRLG